MPMEVRISSGVCRRSVDDGSEAIGLNLGHAAASTYLVGRSKY